jgi:hypothetical protein
LIPNDAIFPIPPTISEEIDPELIGDMTTMVTCESGGTGVAHRHHRLSLATVAAQRLGFFPPPRALSRTDCLVTQLYEAAEAGWHGAGLLAAIGSSALASLGEKPEEIEARIGWCDRPKRDQSASSSLRLQLLANGHIGWLRTTRRPSPGWSTTIAG